MNKFLLYISILISFFILFNCGEAVEKENTLFSGIDPVNPDIPNNFMVTPENKMAILTWDFNDEKDVSNYIIYRSTQLFETYKQVGIVNYDTNTYYDTNLQNGKKFYYYLRVKDMNNNYSDSTDIKRVLIKNVAIPDESAYNTINFTGNLQKDFGNYSYLDPISDAAKDGNDIQEVYMKYDQFNLYLGVKYKYSPNHDLIWMIDTNEEIGANSQRNLDWFGSGRGVDYPNNWIRIMIASWDGNKPEVRYIENNYNTISIDNKDIDIVHNINEGYYEDEIKIPFNIIYEYGAGKVPELCTLKIAILTSAGNGSKTLDTFPDNSNVNGENDVDIISLVSLNIDNDGK